MSYITQDRRDALENDASIDTAGELNYVLSRICDMYITEKGLSYWTLNEVVGVLSCVNSEIYRRIAAFYEDEKLIKKGRGLRECYR